MLLYDAFVSHLMIPQPTLNTQRLELRPLTASDATRVAELANDEELSRNLRSFGFPYGIDDANEWLAEVLDEWEQGKSAAFAVCVVTAESVSNELVGSIGIVLDPQSNRGELGYWIGRNYWGQGIATDASQMMLDFAFGQLGLNKIVAECLDRNPASARVLEKIGMLQEGFLKKHFRKNVTEEYCDVRVFGLLKATWNARKP